MTDNNSMKKARKIVMYYSLGMAFSFWIISLIHLNSFLFERHYLYANWRNIVKTSIISGAPFGLAIWALLAYRFPNSSIDLKFIFTFSSTFFVTSFSVLGALNTGPPLISTAEMPLIESFKQRSLHSLKVNPFSPIKSEQFSLIITGKSGAVLLLIFS